MLELNEKAIIENSLKHGTGLKFKDFIAYNNIDLNSIFVDKLFHNLDSNMPIYFDQAMIEYFGYGGIKAEQLKSVVYLIKANFSDYENKLWFNYNNKKYIEYRENLEVERSTSKNPDQIEAKAPLYPAAPTGRGTSTTKHLLVMPKLFKEMLMLCQTEKGKQVRRYYIDMLDTVDIYLKYQNTIVVRQKDDRIENLMDKLDKMENKADEESKRQEERFNKLIGVATESKEQVSKLDTKLDKVMPNYVDLDELPNGDEPQVVIMRDKDAETDDFNLYIIRCQKRDLNSRIKKLRDEYGENIHRSYTIKQPNAIAFWKNIKKKHSKNIVKASNSNWFKLKNITQRDFYTKINQADVDRKKKA
jgi:hypothetical protein